MALVALAVASTGCGRRATLADCQLIVDKSVELEMKASHLNNPAAIEKREEEIRQALQGDIASCEGRHVTDRTIACVGTAKNTAELDQCLR